MEFRVIIPVRYDSKRLPGKALAEIAGKPMLQHVYERALDSGAMDVIIATDDVRVHKTAQEFGAHVCMTSSDHCSGTERLSEAVVALGFEDEDIVVCLQCDEPEMPSDIIRKVAQDLALHDNVKVSTACIPLTQVEDMFNPNIVKVVLNRRNYALYFSRAPIPWQRGYFDKTDKSSLTLINSCYYRHLGIYAYRVGFLQEYMEWEKSPLEEIEALEQLRILYNGGRIHLTHFKNKCVSGVDTLEDLERIRAAYEV